MSDFGVRDWALLRGQASSPPVPLAGKWSLFIDTDGELKIRKEDGSVRKVGPVGHHEEFLPADEATTVTLAAAPDTLLTVSRNGVVQSSAAGHYSLAGATITFTTAFDGTERVVVTYET
jgi:hypothetical protein